MPCRLTRGLVSCLTLICWFGVSPAAESTVTLPPPPPISPPVHPAAPLPATTEVEPGPFQGTPESLTTYRAPEWFRDAKLGIWSHWGPASIVNGDDWYARRIYEQGHPSAEYHRKHYGHPSVFGYKDVIQTWKAERFDPEHLMDLYAKTGARYFVSIAAHHDNFDLWNSRYHAWNAMNYGPRQDIVGRWRAAAVKRGLRFGLSEHFNRSYSWFNTSHDADKTGPLAGVPYDGNDPRFHDLYFPPHPDSRVSYPPNAPEIVAREWFWRMKDLIAQHQPDFLYSDGGIPFGQVGRDLITNFFNHSIATHGGANEAVYTLKKYVDHGEFIPGVGVHSVERGNMDAITEEPWQCENSIGPWFYKPNIPWQTIGVQMIRTWIDMVSKNGTLLLNIPQRPDGSLDPEAEQFLADLAAWTAIHGEGIFATRPWRVYGERQGEDLTQQSPGKAKAKRELDAQDIRFTRSKDGKQLYLFCLGVPTSDIKVTILGTESGMLPAKIGSIRQFGSSTPPVWRRTTEALIITAQQTTSQFPAIGFALTLE